jgi:hypothetical protein
MMESWRLAMILVRSLSTVKGISPLGMPSTLIGTARIEVRKRELIMSRYGRYGRYDMWGQERHEHIFMGWSISFSMDGKTWQWKLGTKYETKMDAVLRVEEKFPTAKKIKCRKIICEV